MLATRTTNLNAAKACRSSRSSNGTRRQVSTMTRYSAQRLPSHKPTPSRAYNAAYTKEMTPNSRNCRGSRSSIQEIARTTTPCLTAQVNDSSQLSNRRATCGRTRWKAPTASNRQAIILTILYAAMNRSARGRRDVETKRRLGRSDLEKNIVMRGREAERRGIVARDHPCPVRPTAGEPRFVTVKTRWAMIFPVEKPARPILHACAYVCR